MTIRFIRQTELQIIQNGRGHTRTFFEGEIIEINQMESGGLLFIDGRIVVFDNSIFAILMR